MKIRIKGNSIRIRLTKTEVSVFCDQGIYSEETRFNDKSFHYSLRTSDQDENLRATFNDDTITFFVPKEFTANWAENDEVGIRNLQILDDGTELFLLLEKDFVCLDETFEDQSDNYPNPRAQ